MKKSIEFVTNGNTYKVDFPNNGQLIDIELLKSTLSSGRYGSMLYQNTTGSRYALDVIDMEAYITVLIPKLKEDERIDSLADLSIENAIELRKAYKEQLEPFIQEWQKLINDIYKGEDETEKKDK